MENVLQRLLDAELRAQAIVEEAKKERDRLVSEARDEVERAEQRFEIRVPEIYSSFINKAEERAQAQISELERRYHELYELLRQISEQNQEQAVNDVLNLILHVEIN